MKSQHVTTLLSISCVIVAFFLGYAYAVREFQVEKDTLYNTPIYIDISTSSQNITINKSPKNIYFRINGSIMQTGSIDLK